MTNRKSDVNKHCNFFFLYWILMLDGNIHKHNNSYKSELEYLRNTKRIFKR